jgi:uncharacterized protein YcbK (DUF882 family)
MENSFWSSLKYFKKEEFECPCCGMINIDHDFIYDLEEAREEAGIPFVIESASRCFKHNKAVGGVDSSAHCSGEAVDIVVNSSQARYKLLQALLPRFRRIGIGKTFIHVDDDPTKPKEVCWLYD